MSIVYVGLDLGSSAFHQVAIGSDGSVTVNRNFTTSELNLRKAFADVRGKFTYIWKRATYLTGRKCKTKTIDKMV